MPTIFEEDAPPPHNNDDDDDRTVVTSNLSSDRPSTPPTIDPTISPHNPATKTRKVNGKIIGSKRNNIKNIKRKRLQRLIDTQIAEDQKMLAELPTVTPSKSPTIEPTSMQELEPLVTYHMPTPKSTHNKTPLVSQDEYDTTDDCRDDTPTPRDATTPTRRSTRILQRTQQLGPASISPDALYHVAGLGYTDAPLWSVPTKLEDEKLQLKMPIDLQEMCNGVVHPVTNETINKYEKLIAEPLLKDVWLKAMCKELGRLAQGYGDTEGTDTIRFLTLDQIEEIPKDRTVTYARIVVDYRPQKADPNRVRITVGGNLIDYPFELTTRTADLTTTKILWNSIVSTPNAKCACADAKNFYLETPMERHEYMRFPLKILPQEIIDQYDLMPKVKYINGVGYVYAAIVRGMYGLPQAGRLANDLLRERLDKHGYYEVKHTPGLWRHRTRPVWFTLLVDDFCIKYIGEDNLKHLIDALEQDYTMEVDYEGKLYAGITLDWNYGRDRYVDISMPGYTLKQLIRYAHKKPRRPQHCPYSPNPIKYGAKIQEPLPTDDSPLLGPKDIKYIQQVVGSFLYYARAVDPTILMALSSIAADQAAPTENTMKRVRQFLDYMWTHPDAKIRYRRSDMILNLHSDASYLSAKNARSRAGGCYFLGSVPEEGKPIFLNGAILVLCQVLKLVAASAAEAELGALFLNAQEAKVIRITLEELGHPQPKTPISIDNTTTVGIVNNTIKRQKSRAMEMRYFWLLDHEAQKMFEFLYAPGQENLGDFPSKNHFGDIYQHCRPYYVHMPNSPRYLPRALKPSSRRGCAEMLGDSYLKRTPLPSLPQYRDTSSRSRIIRRTDTAQRSHLTRLMNVQAAQLAAMLHGTIR